MTTKRDLAKLTSWTLCRTRKKNQVRSRNCSHHTETGNHRVFENTEASGRSCRHGITSLERRHKHCGTVETRSGRLAPESEHQEVRLVVEAAAALHPNGNALARSTESEHADGRLVAEAAAAAAVHHPDTDMNATATDSGHEDGRLVAEAAEAAAATAKEKPKRRDAMSEPQ